MLRNTAFNNSDRAPFRAELNVGTRKFTSNARGEHFGISLSDLDFIKESEVAQIQLKGLQKGLNSLRP